MPFLLDSGRGNLGNRRQDGVPSAFGERGIVDLWDTTLCRMTGVALHSYVRYEEIYTGVSLHGVASSEDHDL